MKVLLKKEVCGSREQCMGPTEKANSHRNTGLKKKRQGNADAISWLFISTQTGT